MSIPKRLTALRDRLGALEVDCLLVRQPENRRYISGFKPLDTQLGESSGALIISAQEAILATDARYGLQARVQAKGFEVFLYPRGLVKSFRELIERTQCRRVGVESEAVSHRLYEKLAAELPDGVEMVAVADAVEPLRAVKDEEEIAAIRDSLRLTERVLALVRGRLRLGRREQEIAWDIERSIREGGAEAVAFAPIAASGEHSAEPHAEPTNRALDKADSLILDLGARLAGYCSDMTRTLCMGRPDVRFKEVYQMVRQAQQAAQKAVRPGMACAELDAIARDLFAQSGVAEHFAHSLGHGVGLATHEKPSLSPHSQDVLEPGMVITIEPGLYFPGWGGVRLENMVVVRPDGRELLSREDDFYEI
ncbi:MAG: Xaa-Pro peptidase family protein [Pseudomonadota bacterium]